MADPKGLYNIIIITETVHTTSTEKVTGTNNSARTDPVYSEVELEQQPGSVPAADGPAPPSHPAAPWGRLAMKLGTLAGWLCSELLQGLQTSYASLDGKVITHI